MSGRVDLVGAGPGAIDLLTVRAHRLLWEADVVVADGDCPLDDLRSLLGADVMLIDVSAGERARQGKAIDDLLIGHARAGRRVVRLTSGDSFVFGRGAEELRACREAGIAVAVTPGVSAVVAAPASAGIPVTHRGVATGFQALRGEHPLPVDVLEETARGATTTVVQSGVRFLRRIVAEARDAGCSGATPIALVERDGRALRSRLADVLEESHVRTVSESALIVIGDVVDVGTRMPLTATAVAAT